MSKVTNIQLSKKIKELLAMVSAGVITLASTGCGFEGKRNDEVANNPAGFIDEQTLPANETTLSTASSSVETTTTLKPFDKNSGRIKHFDDGTSVVSDYVETSYEDDLTNSGTTYTIAKGTNVVTEKKNEDTTKTSKSTTVKPITTTVKITKTSVDTTKATTKPTTKTTTSTTKATTPKPTTTVTTTTTEAVTEATTEKKNFYNLEDIGNDSCAFYYYHRNIIIELISVVAPNSLFEGDIGYGFTDFSDETTFFLSSVNNDYMSDDCLKKEYLNFDDNCFYRGSYFVFNFKSALDFFEYDCFDYSKYIINQNVGNFLNDAASAYRNGEFDNFMMDNVVSGNISPDVLNNPTAMAILYSYDQGTYLDYNEIYAKMLDNFNDMTNRVFGYSYVR